MTTWRKGKKRRRRRNNTSLIIVQKQKYRFGIINSRIILQEEMKNLQIGQQHITNEIRDDQQQRHLSMNEFFEIFSFCSSVWSCCNMDEILWFDIGLQRNSSTAFDLIHSDDYQTIWEMFSVLILSDIVFHRLLNLH